MTLAINPIKFTHAKFECYLLKVGAKTQLSQIRSKLLGFKLGLDNYKPTILIDCEDFAPSQIYRDLIEQIIQIAKEMEFELTGIARHESMDGNDFAGLPILNLPVNQGGSKHIYNKTLICDEPIRGGLCIQNDGDVIVNNFVADNAEIICSGNIHVYGEAKGRLIAGNGGDKSARIFVSKFNPQLVAIGGVYRVLETKLPDTIYKKSVMVSLDDKDRLNVAPIGD